MKKHKITTHYMAMLAMLSSILVVMSATGIGFIPLPLIKATTMHIPVILGAVTLGPAAGAFLGGVFGLCSIWTNTVTPSILSFAFSPFYADGPVGALKALWISVGCRILIGLVSGWLWIILKKVKVPDMAALPVVGFIGSMTNTVAVMGSIYFLLAEQYAQAREENPPPPRA